MTRSSTRSTTLGDRISEAKRHSGLTYDEIADELRSRDSELRTTKSIVSNWCNQGVVPEGRALVHLPDVLDVDGHWLLTGSGGMVRRDPEEELRAFREISEIVRRVGSVATLRSIGDTAERARARAAEVRSHRAGPTGPARPAEKKRA